MRIGFLSNQSNCVSGASNGIRMQALLWKDALERHGHEVILINGWEVYDWKTFDVVHAFGPGEAISFINKLRDFGIKIVYSPIIDTIENHFFYRIASHWGCKKLRLFSQNYSFRLQIPHIDCFLARSEFEKSYLTESYGIPVERVFVVPLSYRSEARDIDYSKKENFCLHVSSFTQGRKNVMRLMLAAIKYNFRLVLAGNTGTDKSFAPFKKLINDYSNITCLGFVSESQLEELYLKARVFALPSINEGVGLVALEAAMHGCDIVITDKGGPKEYYADLAYVVNPFSVDNIGENVMKAMANTKQPGLQKHIETNYCMDACVKQLIEIYRK